MQIITKSIRIIDYDAQQIYTRATPATFDVYVSELIDHINGNKNVREFKTRSTDTEVIGCSFFLYPLGQVPSSLIAFLRRVVADEGSTVSAAQNHIHLDYNLLPKSVHQSTLQL